MQFSGKIGQIIGWCPPFRVSAPSSGKSLIRHCYPSKWGATSILPDGGTPIPGQGQGVYPGYPLSMSGPRSGQGGYPHPRSGAGGYPHAGQITGQSVGRIPHLRSGWMGTPGTPPPVQAPGRDGGWGYPQPEQQSMHLQYGGQYASCIDALGLSSLVWLQQMSVVADCLIICS